MVLFTFFLGFYQILTESLQGNNTIVKLFIYNFIQI